LLSQLQKLNYCSALVLLLFYCFAKTLKLIELKLSIGAIGTFKKTTPYQISIYVTLFLYICLYPLYPG